MEKMIKTKCPTCGGVLILSNDDEIYTCIYCDTEFNVKDTFGAKLVSAEENSDPIQNMSDNNSDNIPDSSVINIEVSPNNPTNIATNNSTNNTANVSTNNLSEITQVDKTVALLLCIFLGWVGVHKFYEGKIGMGILYALTFGLLLWGPIIDFFIILGKTNPYYIEKK